jgi:hypothetical protein
VLDAEEGGRDITVPADIVAAALAGFVVDVFSFDRSTPFSFLDVTDGVSDAARVCCFTVRLGGLTGLWGVSEEEDDSLSFAFSAGEELSFRRVPTRGGVGGPLLNGSTDLGRNLGRAELLGLGLRPAFRPRKTSLVMSAILADPSSEEVPFALDEARVCRVIVSTASGGSLPIGKTSIDARAAAPITLNRLWREPTSFDFLTSFSEPPDFPLSLFMTSANALLTEESVMEWRTLVACFGGRTAPLALAGSEEGMLVCCGRVNEKRRESAAQKRTDSCLMGCGAGSNPQLQLGQSLE